MNNPNFVKGQGLIPVIIQDFTTQQVLMLGFMNQKAYEKTIKKKIVTFFSRSKNRLWTKGETSGNFLEVKTMHLDCDEDTILIQVEPKGPTCHTGEISCFGIERQSNFVYELEKIIHDRIDSKAEKSYTYELFHRGINKVAQKVGEEAVELVIEAKDNQDDLFLNEAADLLFHYMILLKAKNFKLSDVEDVLKIRHNKKSN
jgi:phosphoribosyl-ATP pyrophosphohydrolase/phosphoribosyl-AMP cyclohydrolase